MVYNKEGPPSIQEEDSSEVSVDIVVGVVECFAGALCCTNKITWPVGIWLLQNGITRVLNALPEQELLNEKWRNGHGMAN